MFKKITIVAVLAALIAAFFYFDLNTYLTLEGLKGSIDDFRQWRDASPVLVLGGFDRQRHRKRRCFLSVYAAPSASVSLLFNQPVNGLNSD